MIAAPSRLMSHASLLIFSVFAIGQIAQAEELTAEQFYERGTKENTAGQYTQALADYNAAIQKNPQFWKAYANRSAAKYNCHDYRGALQDIKTGMAHLPPTKGLTDMKSMVEQAIANESAQAENSASRRRALLRAQQMLLNAQLGLGGDMSSPAYQIERLAETVRARGGTIPKDLVKPIPTNLVVSTGGPLVSSSAPFVKSKQSGSEKGATRGHKTTDATADASPFHVVAGAPQAQTSSSTDSSPFDVSNTGSSTAPSTSTANSNLASKLASVSSSPSTSGSSFSPASSDAHMSAQDFFDRGCGKAKVMDWVAAIKDYDQCILLNPQHGPAYANRGSARFNSGDTRGGLDDFNKAVELMPNNPGVKELRERIVQAIEQMKKGSQN